MLLADSDAVLVNGRVLAQHQAALGLVRQLSQDPQLTHIRWLDLACGRGQILVNVDRVISEDRRRKIHYYGFDVSVDHARVTERRAKELFPAAHIGVCDLEFFETYLAAGDLFDIVTCTNAVHEVSPGALARTFVGALCRTSPAGCLFLYDMERLPAPELGAIPWSGSEIQEILRAMLTSAGVEAAAVPDVAIWPHSTCTCWNLQLHRAYLNVASLDPHRPGMEAAATNAIRTALHDKLLRTATALESAARYGAESEGDRVEIQRLLYDYWAVSRALRLRQAPVLEAHVC